MKINLSLAATLVLALSSNFCRADEVKNRLQIDQQLTGRAKPDIYTPIHPHGQFDEAPGGQNFRTVIPGVLYRGGTGAMTGLSDEQLQLFCSEGFSNVTYGYNNGNFGPVSCAGNKYDYVFANPNDAISALSFLTHVAVAIKTNLGPVYVHCWGGHHESGQLAAYALQLFCGFTPQQAIQYWDRNSNGDQSIGVNVHKRIQWFGNLIASDPRFSQLKAGTDLADLCPSPN